MPVVDANGADVESRPRGSEGCAYECAEEDEGAAAAAAAARRRRVSRGRLARRVVVALDRRALSGARSAAPADATRALRIFAFLPHPLVFFERTGQDGGYRAAESEECDGADERGHGWSKTLMWSFTTHHANRDLRLRAIVQRCGRRARASLCGRRSLRTRG